MPQGYCERKISKFWKDDISTSDRTSVILINPCYRQTKKTETILLTNNMHIGSLKIETGENDKK